MNIFTRWRILGLLLLVLGGAVPLRTAAQTVILTETNTLSPVVVTTPVTYSFNLTNNIFSASDLFGLIVTNSFSTPVLVADFSTNQGSAYYGNTTNAIVFNFGNLKFPTNQLAFFITVNPLASGPLTNTFTIQLNGTNVLTTNFVVAVVNPTTDLSVTNTGFLPKLYVNPAYANDWTTLGVTVSNAGPSTAYNVVLTNTLPAGLAFIGGSPAGQTYTITNGNLLLPFSSLNAGAAQTVYLTFQATNTGTFALTNTIGGANLNDPNLTNNVATRTLSVSNYLPLVIAAATNSPQTLNPKNGFMEQTILVSNTTPTSVPAVRLIVSGLTTNWLYNAVATNAAGPFVVSPAPLGGHQTARLVLQFVVTNRTAFPFTNGQLQAYGVALPNLAYTNLFPVPSTNYTTNLNVRIAWLTSSPNLGRPELLFQSTVSSNYTILYADNPWFNHSQMAQPAVLSATASGTIWVDTGPPATATAPTNSGPRYYRVIQDP